FKPVGLVQTGDVDLAIKEAQRLVDMGYEILTIPAVVWAQDKVAYNDPRFERLWAALEELGKPIAIHVATGRDPRAAKGNGGAICNFVMGAMSQVIEPFAVLLASGVFERYPNLKIGSVEGGVGWVPWLLETLDYVYHTHHMWVRPTLKHPPSHYYRQNCFSSIVEDHVGVAAMQRAGLINNVMWGSDAPHMEGSFPHSPLSLERQLQELTEAEREAVLGLNAVRIFGFDPAKKFCEAKA
ncbi:MAG TPA: amidohydrolase family protein, partial [Macromonas sp.]|nr:amidohydrolase family protein [Macromonas sp.]